VIAASLVVLLPFTLAWLVWMVFFMVNDPSEEIRHAKHLQFLGPGGPDDPFANDPYDDLAIPSQAERSETAGGE
jgi:hypothetical protein